MARKRRGSRRIDVESVLGGAIEPTAAELIGLIHRVNPSGEGLAAREEQRRYAQKSALQSLLIRRFGDYLDPAPHGADGVISLRHRLWQEDAAHAVVAELDDDARSWVRARLDGVADGVRADARGAVEAVDEPVTDALILGQRAREAYDYEEARRCFEEALTSSRGAPGPAVALLQLLVDDLAGWSECGALAERLPVATREHPDVAGLLCEAAGRRGDVRSCRTWARLGAEPRRTAGLAAAARHVLEADPDLAEELLATVDAGLRGSVPELDAAVRKLKARRARDRDAARQAWAEAVRGLDDEAFVARTEAFLAKHPDDVEARQALDEARRRLAEPKLRALLDEASEALSAGELSRARRALRGARALSPDAQELAALTASLAAAEEARAERERLAKVSEHLEAGRLAEALRVADELSLPDHAELPAVARGYLALRAHHPREPADTCIAAMVALDEAERALDGSEAPSAAARIDPFRRLLEAAPETATAVASVRARCLAARREFALACLAGVAEALDGGDVSGATQHFEALRLGDLDEADREVAAALRGRLRQARTLADERGRLQHRWERIAPLTEPDCAPSPSDVPRILSAMDAARAALESGADPELWRRRLEACRSAARRHARVEVLPPGFFDDERNLPIRGHGSPAMHVNSAGVGLGWTVGDRLVLRDVVTGEVRRTVLPGPGPWWHVVDERDPSSLRVLVTDGERLGTLEHETLEPLAWQALPVALRDAEQIAICAEFDTVWAVDRADDGTDGGAVRVLDLTTGAVRELPVLASLVYGNEDTGLMFSLTQGGVCRLWTPGGEPAEEFASPLWDYRVIRASSATEPAYCFVMVAPGDRRKEFEEEFGVELDPIGIAVAVLKPDGEPECLGVVKLGEGRISMSAVMSARHRLVFAVIDLQSGERELRALSWDGLEEVWRCRMSPGSEANFWAWGRDHDAKLAYHAADGWRHVTLGPTPPDLPPARPGPPGELPHLDVGLRGQCGPGSTKHPPGAIAAARRLSSDTARSFALMHIKERARDPRALASAALQLHLAGSGEARDLMLDHVGEQYPGHWAVAAVLGGIAADDGDWEGVLTTIQPALATAPDQHLLHLRVVALLRLGRWEEARRELSGRRETWHGCNLEELERLIEPVPAEPTHLVSRLRVAVRDATLALEAASAGRALMWLEHSWLRAAGEVQSLGRLVQAHLLAAPHGEFTAAAEIAMCGWLRLVEDGGAPNLPYPEGFMDDEAIAALAGRARAALGGRSR